jgi:hypothetical protein
LDSTHFPSLQHSLPANRYRATVIVAEGLRTGVHYELYEDDTMTTIEFQTYIDQGTIELPKEYQDRVKGRARVIILAEDIEEDVDMIAYLLEHPYGLTTFTPLTRDEIYERQ